MTEFPLKVHAFMASTNDNNNGRSFGLCDGLGEDIYSRLQYDNTKS